MLLTVTNVTASAGFFRVAESALMELEHLSASRDALSREKKEDGALLIYYKSCREDNVKKTLHCSILNLQEIHQLIVFSQFCCYQSGHTCLNNFCLSAL